MLRGRGQRLLFADADGATKFADIDKLETELEKIKQLQRQVTTSNFALWGRGQKSELAFFGWSFMDRPFSSLLPTAKR